MTVARSSRCRATRSSDRSDTGREEESRGGRGTQPDPDPNLRAGSRRGDPPRTRLWSRPPLRLDRAPISSRECERAERCNSARLA